MSRRFLKQLDVAPPFTPHGNRVYRDDWASGGGTTQTTNSTNSSPWGAVQPYLKDIFNRAQGLAQRPVQSPNSVMAQNFQANNALTAGSPIQQAYGQAARTIGGEYLTPDSNPYLRGAVQTALDQVKENVNTQFRGDNYGGSANQEWLGRKLADRALPIYADNYQRERGNQLNAMLNAGNIQSQVPNALAAAGAAEENAPWNQLANYQRAISGGLGAGGTTSGTQQNPYYTNPISSLLGAGIGGLTLYNGLNKAGLLNFGGSNLADAAPIISGFGAPAEMGIDAIIGSGGLDMPFVW